MPLSVSLPALGLRAARLLACLGLGACGPAAMCERFALDCELDESGPAFPESAPEDGDGDIYSSAVDCDDTDPAIHPGAEELCDGIDNDCDGVIDNGHDFPRREVFPDADHDGFGGDDSAELDCSLPDGWLMEGGDCDDHDPEIHPEAEETCEAVDRNCDGDLYEGADASELFFVDADGDGWGRSDQTEVACAAIDGLSELDGDCDDSDPDTNPHALETCEEVDRDCDGDATAGAWDAEDWYADADGDGFGDALVVVESCDPGEGWVQDEQDCDDADAGTAPGAEECPDGRDNDCDGEIDEDLDSSSLGPATEWYADTDDDGFGDPEALILGCQAPLQTVADATDCDDTRAHVHPGGQEVCGDYDSEAADEDCDGLVDEEDDSLDTSTWLTWYVDRDDDGSGEASATDTACTAPQGYVSTDDDCDDSDPDTWPGAPERCGDGVVNDCDGTWADAEAVCELDVDVSVASSPWSWSSGGAGDWLGGAADLGDLDGDGLAEVILAAWVADDSATDAGRVHILSGSEDDVALDLDEAWATVDGAEARDYLGRSVAVVDDLDGDGLSDLILGAHGADGGGSRSGAVWLLTGLSSGALDLDEAQAVVTGTGTRQHLGLSLDGAGDTDGDGLSDLVLGAPEADGSEVDAGRVSVLLGPVSGSIAADETAALILGSEEGDLFGTAVAGGADLDGDGLDDLVVGASGAQPDGSSAQGGVYLFLGPLSGEILAEEADAVFMGDRRGDNLGVSVDMAGDTDGDGLGDVIMGAHGADNTAARDGTAWLALGSTSLGGSASASACAGAVTGEEEGARVGFAVAGVGDVDLDGFDDLLVGAPGAEGEAAGSGMVALVMGPLSGSWTLSTAGPIIAGDTEDGALGEVLAGGADVDGDGRPDLLLSGQDDAGEGRVHLWTWENP